MFMSTTVRVIGRRVLLLCATWYFFAGVTFEMKAARRYEEVSGWPVTQAVIETTSVSWQEDSLGGYRCCPKLRYRYFVAGAQYRGSNSTFDFSCSPNGYDFIAQHKADTTIQIAYDPNDVKVSLVRADLLPPSSPWPSCVVGVFCLALLASDLAGLWKGGRSKVDRQ
jgi:Protein of unknown function (DUF3592)